MVLKQHRKMPKGCLAQACFSYRGGSESGGKNSKQKTKNKKPEMKNINFHIYFLGQGCLQDSDETMYLSLGKALTFKYSKQLSPTQI